MRRFLLPLVLLCIVIPCYSADSQVEFVAKLVSVEKTSDTVGTLKLQLTPDFNLEVKVTEQTDIRGEGDVVLTLGELKPDMLLRIEGVFAEGGILASEITAINLGAARFGVRGLVEAVDATKQEIKVIGLTIKVTAETEIKGADGEVLQLADLKVGEMAWIEGEVTPTGLVASEIRIRELEFKPPRLTFEGVVTEVKEDQIMVLVKGVDKVLVRLTTDTEVKGDLAVGKFVRVAGTIANDLSVNAKIIFVLEPIQLAPSKLRLHPGKVMPVVVILRTHPEDDVEVQVTSKDPTIAEVSSGTVVIPAGKIVGVFRVTAKAEGITTIEVKLPDSLGGSKTVMEVEVKAQGNDIAPGQADVSWHPDSLNIPVNGVRMAMLKLEKAPAEQLVVKITVKEGDGTLLEGPETVTFPAGLRILPVIFKAGEKTGTLVLRATLPDEVGGDYADLEVEVKAK